MRLLSITLASLLIFAAYSQQAVAEESAEPEVPPYTQHEKSFGEHVSRFFNNFRSRPEADFTRRYKDRSKTTQYTQWERDGWHPEDWVIAKGDIETVMHDFKKTGMIIDFVDVLDVESDKVPTLKVGELFTRASPRDQSKIVEFVDYAYDITARSKDNMFYIVLDARKKELLGTYNKNGLQFK